MEPIRVLVVDDHFMARIGLTMPIDQQPDMAVVGDAGTSEAAVAAYRDLLPDVVIMDYRLPDRSGPDTVRQIRQDYPGARVLMVSAFEKEEPISRAVHAGVCGYLTKEVDCSEVLDAIRRIHRGQTVFADSVREKIELRKSRAELSARELDILALIVRGRSNKEIANELFLSESSIKQDLTKMLRKLGAPDRTRAATLAIERGFFDMDD